MDLNKIESAPWREANAKQSDYFNYGFNEDLWKKYSSVIQAKFDSLSELVAQQKYNFPKLKDEFNYLLNFPSDYGGLGDVLNDQKFDNVNFFEMKANSHQMAPLIRIDHDQLYVPLEVNSPALNSNSGNIPNNSVPLNNNFISAPYNSFPVMPRFNPELYKYMYQPNLLMQQKEEMMKKQDIESDKQSRTNEKKHSSKKSSQSDEDNDSSRRGSDSDDDSSSSSESSERKKKRKRRHKRHSHRSRSRDSDESNRKKRKKRSSHSKSRERSKRSRSRSRSRHRSRSRKKDKGEDDKYESKRDKHRRKH